MWGMTRYQWTVLFAAWLGWGFDIFDSILFNFVAPNCIPTLLHLPVGSPEARAATLYWTGVITSLLLVGWAIGGVLFGQVCDRFGRLRTLVLTMLLFAAGTAACAAATSIGMLVACRVVASLGIGGEWAAGAAMVAEVMPDNRRVHAGALLYTSAVFGLALAMLANYLIAGVFMVGDTEHSWRYVFLCGLLPAAVTLIVRRAVREPERWRAAHDAARARLADIFRPELRARTASGMITAVVAMVTWWSCNAFLPTIVTGLARTEAARRGFDAGATLALVEQWKLHATATFNLGGLVGTLLTIPLAGRIGRRNMFLLYFACSSAAIFGTYGIDMPAQVRIWLFFFVGLPVFGVFGAFPFYLPELFPTRLRATGGGFTYNIGRLLAAVGPFLVGAAAQRGAAMSTVFYVGFVPIAGLLLAPWIMETKGQALPD